jgi:hypothetical protein
VTAHTARAHAKLSPSGAHRWINCPGSIRESAGVVEKSSVFADEGTAAHTLAELCLSERLDAVDFLGGHVNVKSGKVFRNPGEGDRVFAIDDEMVDAVQVYVDEVRRLTVPGDEVEYEAKLDLSHIPGMAFGTGDCVIYRPGSRHLIIADLKYGKGVPVDAEDNPQTRAYALGAAQRFHNRGVATIESVIVQPRCPHPDGAIRRELIDAIDLLEFRMDLEAAAAATAAPDAPLNPGEWCVFCPAKATCAALRGRVLAAAEMEFADEPPPVSSLDADFMARVLRQAGLIKGWLKGVEERAHQMARDGTPPTGFKLVASKAFRRWTDEAATERYLATVLDLTEDQIYAERKINSPAQMEKVVGAKRKSLLADLITAKSSGTILVPSDDPRPPAKADAEDEFASAV